jgi:formate hydrogenlyase transcriptional activator
MAAPDYPQGALARYRALLEIIESISAHSSFEKFFHELSASLSRIIHVDSLSLTLWDTDQKTTKLYLIATEHAHDIPLGRSFPLEETAAFEVLKTQKPFYAPDLDRESRHPLIDEMLRRNKIRSYCVVPLSTARNMLGGLQFASARPDAYSPEDLEFMQLVARQAAVVLENVLSREAAAASREELARERDHLRTRLKIHQAVADKLDTRELFSAISLCLREALNVEYASLALFDPENNCLRRHSLDFPGGSGLLQEGAVIPIENTGVGEAFAKATPVLALRADIERMLPDMARRLLEEGLKLVCAVPLKSRSASWARLT